VTRSTKVKHLIRRLYEVGSAQLQRDEAGNVQLPPSWQRDCSLDPQALVRQQAAAAAEAEAAASDGAWARHQAVVSELLGTARRGAGGAGLAGAGGAGGAPAGLTKSIVYSSFWVHLQLIGSQLSAAGIRCAAREARPGGVDQAVGSSKCLIPPGMALAVLLSCCPAVLLLLHIRRISRHTTRPCASCCCQLRTHTRCWPPPGHPQARAAGAQHGSRREGGGAL
jgi:hypothetical protein